MLTRLEIDGFKSFENFSVDFAPLTVIVGGNAAGKSNLFDVIALLSNLATRDVAEAVKGLRGEPLEFFRRTPTGQVSRIRLAAGVLIDLPWCCAPLSAPTDGRRTRASCSPIPPSSVLLATVRRDAERV